MPDNPTFYDPPAQEKRGPGRPSNAEVERRVTATAAQALRPPQEQLPEPAPETLDQVIARIRTVRQAFGGPMSQKLALPTRSGYHRHWFNDVGGRIDEAKASGWSHVNNPRDGKPLRRAVGTGRDNGVLYAFAMEIPEVFWQEEMDAKHAQAKAKIDDIKTKPFQAKPGTAQVSDKGKFYDPTESRGGAGPITVTKG
jgi:hypothetical protein